MLTANGIAYSFSKFSKCKNSRGPSEKAAVCFARTSVQLPNHTWCTSLLLQWVSSKSRGSVFARPFAPFLILSRPQRGAKKKRYTGGYQKPPHPVPPTHSFSTFPANICTLIATLFLTHCFLSVETHSHASLSLLSSYRLRMPSKTCDVTVESCFCAIASSLCLLTLLCSFH